MLRQGVGPAMVSVCSGAIGGYVILVFFSPQQVNARGELARLRRFSGRGFKKGGGGKGG